MQAHGEVTVGDLDGALRRVHHDRVRIRRLADDVHVQLGEGGDLLGRGGDRVVGAAAPGAQPHHLQAARLGELPAEGALRDLLEGVVGAFGVGRGVDLVVADAAGAAGVLARLEPHPRHLDGLVGELHREVVGEGVLPVAPGRVPDRVGGAVEHVRGDLLALDGVRLDDAHP